MMQVHRYNVIVSWTCPMHSNNPLIRINVAYSHPAEHEQEVWRISNKLIVIRKHIMCVRS